MTVAEPTSPAEVADFHLVESRDGWLLSINMTPQMLNALRNVQKSVPLQQISGISMRIEPNLVPGTSFQVDLRITQPER